MFTLKITPIPVFFPIHCRSKIIFSSCRKLLTNEIGLWILDGLIMTMYSLVSYEWLVIKGVRIGMTCYFHEGKLYVDISKRNDTE